MRTIVGAVMALSAHAMAQCDYDLLSTYDSLGITTGVRTVSDIAYIADGVSGLTILDVSDATNPTFLGSAPTQDEAMRIQVQAGLAYIADDTGGLRILDITDPTAPAFLGAFPTADQIFDVAVDGTTAYLAADQLGVQVVDVSDPTQPVLLGEADPANEGIRGVDVQGTTVYTVGVLFKRFEAFDVSNPMLPASIWDVVLADVGRKVLVDGTLAYVACNTAGVQIYDVSLIPPQVIGVVPTDNGAFDVALEGTTLVVAQNLGGVQIVDVSDPTAPNILDVIDPPGFVRGVDIVDGTVYGCGDTVGLHVIGCPCAADVNGDGNLNILDFVAFQALFINGDPAADCDGNGQFNILDFVCFQALFSAGC